MTYYIRTQRGGEFIGHPNSPVLFADRRDARQHADHYPAPKLLDPDPTAH